MPLKPVELLAFYPRQHALEEMMTRKPEGLMVIVKMGSVGWFSVLDV
jgi:hypothetical protein